MDNEYGIWYDKYIIHDMGRMMLEEEKKWFFEIVEGILKDEEET